jgi:hypothetical protein
VAPLIVVNGPIAARSASTPGSARWAGLARQRGDRPRGAARHAEPRRRLARRRLARGLSQPGRYTLCLAERDDGPWPPLHVELGYRPDQSTVTVWRAETAINVTGGLAELASVMGSAASAFTMLYAGRVAVIVAPFVARTRARDGWSKDDVKRHRQAEARVAGNVVRAWWLRATAREWPERFETQDLAPAFASPDDITVLVAGADLAIPHLAYFPSWGFPPCRITREIATPVDGVG